MLYNFNKNIIKNDNNSYTLNIILPKKYKNLKYKIYNNKFVLQSGFFENSKIRKNINIDIDKLDTIFILMNLDSTEYFELINLKNLYKDFLENIKINFIKNNSSDINKIIYSNINHLNNNEEDDDDEDDDEDEENDIEEDNDEDNDIEEDDDDENNEDDQDDDENNSQNIMIDILSN